MVPSSSAALELHEITPDPFTGAERAAERTMRRICATSSPFWQRRRSARRRHAASFAAFPQMPVSTGISGDARWSVDPVPASCGTTPRYHRRRLRGTPACGPSQRPSGRFPATRFRRLPVGDSQSHVRQDRTVAQARRTRPSWATSQTLMSRASTLTFTLSRSGAEIGVQSCNRRALVIEREVPHLRRSWSARVPGVMPRSRLARTRRIRNNVRRIGGHRPLPD
jgi:hypothetical protein